MEIDERIRTQVGIGANRGEGADTVDVMADAMVDLDAPISLDD